METITLQKFKNLGKCPKFGFDGKLVSNNDLDFLLLKKTLLLNRIIKELKINQEEVVSALDIDLELEATEWANTFQLHTIQLKNEMLDFNKILTVPFDNFELKGKIDLLFLKDSDEPYLELIRLKTGEGISYRKDSEALFLSFIVMSIYGLPVKFNRIGHDGQKFSSYFSVEEMEQMKQILTKYLTLSPDSTNIGEHCSQCSFVSSCKQASLAQLKEDSLDSIMEAEMLINSELKQIRAKKNALIKEKQFVRGERFVGKIEAVPSYKLDFGDTEKLNKEKLKDWLLKDYVLPEPLVSNLQISTYSEEFAEWLNNQNRGVSLKPYFRKVVKVEEIKEDEE